MSRNKTVAARLAAARKENNYTQEEIADLLKCSRATITNYENGRRSPDYESLVILAKKYNVTTDYLLGVTGAETTDKDIRYICDYTGLSEKAVEKLNKYKLCSECEKDPLTDEELAEMALGKRKPDLAKTSMTLFSREFKNYIFILNSLITTGESEFDKIIKGIEEYILNNANLKVPPMEYMIHFVVSNGDYELNNYDNYIVNERIEENRKLEQKDFNDYKLYTLSKRLKNAADLIADEYIKFRGEQNGND